MTVTVIVPVYGVEKYIVECAESLFAQTYSDIEYVFCDDCTPDRSMELLCEVIERYPERKEHVRIIRNEQNKGLGGTRRHLISHINTEAFLIVDSDDILPPQGLDVRQGQYASAGRVRHQQDGSKGHSGGGFTESPETHNHASTHHSYLYWQLGIHKLSTTDHC